MDFLEVLNASMWIISISAAVGISLIVLCGSVAVCKKLGCSFDFGED